MRVSEVRGAADPKTPLWQGLQPEMASAMAHLSQTVYANTKIDFRTSEAARMTVAEINGCLVCGKGRVGRDVEDYLARTGTVDAEQMVLERGEVPDEEFYLSVPVWRESAIYSDRERLAIEFAERVSLSPRDLPHDENFWERMHATFTDVEITDLAYSITTWIACGRFIHILGFDGSCEVPSLADAAAERLAAVR